LIARIDKCVLVDESITMNFVLRILPACTFSLVLITQTFADESLEQTINYLLHYVETSKATFIRNGTEHTPAEASKHIKAKYDHFKNEIKTPEDFIRFAASKSLLTGKPYLVRTPDGKETHLDAWLTEALKTHRAQSTQ
jgi:hypothetical protein